MKNRFLFGIAMVVCFALIFLSPFAQATQLRQDFSADIAYPTKNFSDYISGDTFSGYLIYDSETVADSVDEDTAGFSFLNNPASLYVDQLDATFNLEHWTNYGTSEIWVNTDYQDIPGKVTGLFFAAYSMSEDFLFNEMTSLPASINQTVVSDGNAAGYIEFEALNYHGAELFFNTLTLSTLSGPDLPDLPLPVLNGDGGLLLDGDGLASRVRINEGDPDLITTQTVVGYEAEGQFVHTGALHQTAELLIGGNPNDFYEASGQYTMTGENW